eukprot:TRINITY_DN24464_c0_g1_i1.p1 TRINITY_DN24464_c0_g1~~TRINITY_DN24464_c0_g1_i1.p1  ORF type:complete len:102 (+),score=17.94 TRINITY_DN24464_c0_g1_i1:201-506(+)
MMMPQLVPSALILILWSPWLSLHTLLGLSSFSWMEQNLVPEGLSHRHTNPLLWASQEKDIASPSFTALPYVYNFVHNTADQEPPKYKMIMKDPAVILHQPS